MPYFGGQPPGTQYIAFKVLDVSIALSAFARVGGNKPRASSLEIARPILWRVNSPAQSNQVRAAIVWAADV